MIQRIIKTEPATCPCPVAALHLQVDLQQRKRRGIEPVDKSRTALRHPGQEQAMKKKQRGKK
jgi:hypothetical protein